MGCRDCGGIASSAPEIAHRVAAPGPRGAPLSLLRAMSASIWTQWRTQFLASWCRMCALFFSFPGIGQAGGTSRSQAIKGVNGVGDQ